MYKEKLYEAGLLRKRTAAEEDERKSVLQRLANGEVIPKDLRPIFCVFRKDNEWNHIQYEGEKNCKDAELIESKLCSGEAWWLCNMLNIHAPDIKRTDKGHTIPMYGICKDVEWEEWERKRSQLRLDM